ncbi:AraC family transcriptional regulator [Marinoscillum furvescens]|uniref:AraC family transcriptional regulator n=1 Tax=Marinoscillum furvescens DSM 4134 TaxID=1122208 RepID=A0A3D9LAG2_MARFU|nr:AraC family transcriptional regulator [Marinoscillum furvescens]REE02223.1 AraC family transcriptional regulator [Marinoscillum furvescens DSM 4134]
MQKNRALGSGFKGEKIVVIPRGMLHIQNNRALTHHLYITDIGYFPKAVSHYRKRPDGCPEYILIYCIEGKGGIKTGNRNHEMLPNSFFIIEREKAHTYFSHKTQPWTIYWVHFAGTSADHIYERFIGLNQGKPVSIPYQQNKISEFEYIMDTYKLGFTDQVFEYSSMLLHKLLGSFIYYSLKSNTRTESNNDDLVKDITEYLNEKIFESIRIEDIEKRFSRSSSTLFTLFKNKTGYSLIHFFNLIKIQKACELMNLTDLSIKEIGYKLDFRDPLYFSRVFKKYMGTSPSAYRKSL